LNTRNRKKVGFHFHNFFPITHIIQAEEQQHNFLGLFQNKNIGPLLKNSEDFQENKNQTLNQTLLNV
jgi:hypothetical protein